ncbi:hypothetical protein DVA67_030035 [Solirubrobacter sp. CPCC 204708]|uniref:Phytanoyl-CoA dioxygenase family protein n=1 Tax=Solirubrobacter deserti TaxID=2282478 RepID=A0ABT4RIK3_9ACTN|nr:hypothetical protein [Solirubrobacter deserti]MBE2320245.1 hypothetical protein [Solirubrobacter deserti]MDA0138369.1 hypothetical protein [Solirubrobacter deserti]
MNTVYVDTNTDEATRRERLYNGHLFVLAPRPSTLALVEHAREMIEAAFGDIDPALAQYEMPVERYVEICAPLKPAFIHNDRTKQLLKDVVEDFGCVLEETFIDVPRLRMVTSDGYLTSGVGYAHHPHRDTWYSAPMAQLNWWLPIYDIETEQSMAFHPHYFDKAIKNGSSEFNYYDWNSSGRKDAAKQIKSDTRKQPKPEEELELEPSLRLLPPAGGIVLFSAAHLHSTVPNTSGRARYSIDFRTVNAVDLAEGKGAPNLDSHCTGTSLRDFIRGSDRSAMPEELVAKYDDESSADGVLVYQPA